MLSNRGWKYALTLTLSLSLTLTLTLTLILSLTLTLSRYVPPPPLVPGQVVVLDHRIRLDTTLSAFNWEDYEHALGRLASCAAPTDCFISPEPGESFVTAHATLVVRTGPSDRMATISTAIRALQQKSALKRAAGGATLLGGPRVTLLGEVVELAQPTP